MAAKKPTKRAKPVFPATIFVTREFDNSDKSSSWLNAYEGSDSIDHDETVAVYELAAIKKKIVSHDLA